MSSTGAGYQASLYYYIPNKIAPIIFSVLFAITAIWHIWQCYRYKYFKVTGFYPLTSVLFATGFALREYGAYYPRNVNVFVTSTMMIYLSPPLLELANYTILSRILFYVPYNTPMHPGRVLIFFGSISAIVEALNGIAISFIATPSSSPSDRSLGQTLMKVALIVQLCVILFFVFLAGIFWHRCIKGGIRSRKVTLPLATLYTSMGLILIRTIYRCIEHFAYEGVDYSNNGAATTNPLLRHEWYFYVFEAAVMLVNSYLWNFLHPRRFLPENRLLYLSRDGVTERIGPKWTDSRPMLLKIMDPFGITAMVGEFAQKDNMKDKYWENDTNASASQTDSNAPTQNGEARFLLDEEQNQGHATVRHEPKHNGQELSQLPPRTQH